MTRKRNVTEEFVLSDIDKNLKNKDIIKNIFLTKPKVAGKNESQKKLILSIKNNEITICSGIAGSGKSYISLAYALSLLYDQKNKYNKIYLLKSVTTLKNEEIGFLKGTLENKIEPFMWSFKINMEKIITESEIKSLFDSDIIRHVPLAYIRGTSIDNAIIIADEFQNISIDNARTFMTRIGSDSKLILIGDSNQIDLKNKNESSLEILMNMFKDIEEIGTIRMDDNDNNCRNPIIKIIEDKFKKHINYDYDTLKRLHKDFGNGRS